ncbi:hypothetical protein [Arenibaculum pallidiluteum]|uniref:hypothetical protein n=1 Tax=Arenibaculum pallidiluteum TaxID=2812559 RepID=UPI001A97101C|nr:hypothetical protein [Arenibaculum pallidiluteum]
MKFEKFETEFSAGALASSLQPQVPALDYALEMVAQLGKAGLAAVPVKPSVAMLTAGARAGGVSVETAWKIYQAMLKEEG